MGYAKEAEHDRVEPGSDPRQDLARAPRDPGRRRSLADGRRTAPDHRARLQRPASGGPGTAAARGPLGCRRPRREGGFQEDPGGDDSESARSAWLSATRTRDPIWVVRRVGLSTAR